MNLQEYNNKYHQGQIGISHLTDPIGEFYEICKFGDIEAVKFLLHSDEAPCLPDLHEQVRRAINAACTYNHLELLKYLFSLEKSHNIVIPEQMLFYSFDSAAKEGNLKILNFFLLPQNILESPKISIETYGNDFLITAAREGQYDILKYLLTHEKFTEHINVHCRNDLVFRYVVTNNHKELMQFLIVDFNIAKTKYIEEFLKNDLPLNVHAKKMFELQEINSELTNQLNCKSISTKKVKI
jgi:ankyrin repeat protein